MPSISNIVIKKLNRETHETFDTGLFIVEAVF